MNFDKIKKVYIIGIEGGGTSALASFLKERGAEVSGSDEGDHFFNSILTDKGIKVFAKFNKENVPDDVDLVVYSTAFTSETNEELKIALEKYPKQTKSYAIVLSELFNSYKENIAVCGTHGKTTTTAWLGYIMDKAELNPNAIIGAKVVQLKGSILAGDSEYFLIEADEYQNKLQYYKPKNILLNNVDYDHPDFFNNKSDYDLVFKKFIEKIPTEGFLAVNFDDETAKKTAKENCKGKIISYSLLDDTANFFASDIQQGEGTQTFNVNNLGEFTIKLFGKHNISNALAVIATCLELGIATETIKEHLSEFTGTERRLQKIGEFNKAIILDDFAHHPTEIKTTIQGVKKQYSKTLDNGKLIVVFHPHTFSRTKSLFNDFLDSFINVDELIVLDIYGSAREEQGGVSSADLVEKMKLVHEDMNAKHIPSLKECEEYLRNNLKENDILILMGAGDVFKIGENLINN